MTTTPIFESHSREHTILESIKEGMKVFDANNNALGHIDNVYLGEASPQAIEAGAVPATVSAPYDASNRAIDLVQRVFGKDELPEELRARLLQHGFIHVNVQGLLSHNRYVLPEQITQVTSEGVVLRATRKELIKE